MQILDDPKYKEVLLSRIRGFIDQYVPTEHVDWDVFSSVLDVVAYQPHEMLLHQGDVAKYIYCICEGVIRKYTTRGEKEYTLSFNFPVSFFSSYISFSDKSPSKISIQTITQVKAGVISFEKMRQLYQKAPHASEIGLKMLELAHKVNIEKEISQNTHTAEENYRYLLEHNQELVLQIPNIYIASYLGITPESLSRIRKRIFQ